MQNIDVRFNATTNFGRAQAALAGLTNQVATLNAELEANRKAGAKGLISPDAWRSNAKAVEEFGRAYRDAASSTGMLNAQQIRSISQTERYTEMMQKQKLSLRDMLRNRKLLQSVYNDQLRLQRMTVMPTGTDAMGREVMQITTPKAVPKELDTIRQRLGFISQATANASQQMINWGKNTQWAGRQLTVGLSVPIAIFGAAAGKAAYDADKQLTRIVKVYDTTAKDSMGRAKELADVRAQGLEIAAKAARDYGSAMTDTLGVEAELAATGVKGLALRKSTAEVMRISALGELDQQAATKTTIALQTAFKMNTKQLTDTFNFFNATENATSLSLQDISEAVPRAASAMAGLGVTAKEMTIMLVAMRERGVDAAEGANALKSATTRILNPTKKAVEYYKQFGINLNALSTESGGNLFKFLKLLGSATSDMNNLQKQRGIGNLFGTYQFNRLNAAITGIGDAYAGVGNQASQTAKAMQVANMTSEQTARIANQEMQQAAESASGKFKRAFATLKVELAEMGKPFLEFAATMASGGAKILRFFNALPDSVKKGFAIAALLTAIIGPSIMLVGLFGNLMGQGLRLAGALLGIGNRFEILTKHQQAARVLSEQMTVAMQTEAESAQMLKSEIMGLAEAYGYATGAAQTAVSQGFAGSAGGALQRSMSQTRPDVPGVVSRVDKAGRERFYPAGGGRQIPKPKEIVEWERAQERVTMATNRTKNAMADAEKQAGGIKDEVEKTNKGIGTGTKLMGASAAAMLVAQTTSGGTAHAVGTIAQNGLLAAMAMQSFNVQSLKGFTLSGAITKSASALPGMIAGGLRGIAAAIGPVGAAVGLVTGAYLTVKSIMHSSIEQQQRINDSAKDWATTLGYVYQGYNRLNLVRFGQQQTGADQQAAAQAAYEANPAVTNRYREISDPLQRQKFALSEFFKMMETGATKADALNGIRLMFIASGDSIDQAQAKMMKFNQAVSNIRNSGDTAHQTLQKLKVDMDSALADRSAMGKNTNYGKFNWKFMLVEAQNIFGPMVENAGKTGEMAGEELGTRLASSLAATKSIWAKGDMFNDMVKAFNDKWKDAFNSLSTTSRLQLQQMGIRNANEYRRAMSMIDQMGPEGAGKALGLNMRQITALEGTRNDNVKRLQGYEKGVAQSLANQLGYTGEIHDFQNLIGQGAKRQLGDTKAQAIAEFQRRTNADKTSFLFKKMTNEQKLQVLNQMRQERGLGKATNLAQMFDEITTKTTEHTKQQADAHEQVNKALERRKEVYRNFDPISEAQGAMSNVTGAVADELSATQQRGFDRESRALDESIDRGSKALDRKGERVDAYWQRRTDAMNAQFERRDKALAASFDRRSEALASSFDKRSKALARTWDRREAAVNKAYDHRINAVNNAIKAEQKADALRQKMFDAEVARINRLAEMANSNIDFNVAVDTGKLDEAAKLVNNREATQMNWAMEDSNAAAGAASQNRQDALQARADRIEKQRAAATDRLQKQRAAAEERLAKQRENAEKRLDKLRKNAENRLARLHDAAQKNMQQAADHAKKQVQLEKDRYQKQSETRRRFLQEDQQKRKQSLDQQLALLRAFIPRNKRELMNHIRDMGKNYNEFGKALKQKGDNWAQFIGDATTREMRIVVTQLKSKMDWAGAGKAAATGMIRGAFGMSVAAFRKWLGMPGIANPTYKPKKHDAPGGASARRNNSRRLGNTFHRGGIVGAHGGPGNMRAGYPGGSAPFSKEQLILAKAGEGVLNERATKALGPDGVKALNSGALNRAKSQDGKSKVGKATGGPIGMSGVMMAGFTQILRTVISAGLQKGADAASARDAALSAAGGSYTAGKVKGFTAEQMRNAAIIASTGSKLGASSRDIQIALITAIVESGLRNLSYGDRDSVGLFQQRNAWGSFAERTDPAASARMFFTGGHQGQRGLFDFKNRNNMSMGEAAQSVQVSAFPGRYQQHVAEAARIFAGLHANTPTGVGNIAPGHGGWNRPIPGHAVGHTHAPAPGTDIGVPVGTPIYSVGPGTVLRSRDIPPIPGRHNVAGYGSYGRYVMVGHNVGGKMGYSLYAHMSRRIAREGNAVRGGSLLGISGQTGNTYGPHLHFEAGWGTRPNTAAYPDRWLAARGVPGLKKGGDIRWDNTLINTHKDEKVLTAPLSKSLERGIDRMERGDTGGTLEINFNMQNIPSHINEDLLADRVIDKIERRTTAIGRRRVIKS